MSKNNVNMQQYPRKNEPSTNGWFFWSYEDIIPSLFRIFTGSKSKPKNATSKCGVEIKKLSTNYPEHKEYLQLVGKIIELTDSSSTLDSMAKEKMRKLDFLITQEKELKKYISDVENKLDKEINAKNRLENKFHKVSEERDNIRQANISYMDKKVKKNNPILWGQSLDAVWEYNPLLVEKLEKNSKLYPKEYDTNLNGEERAFVVTGEMEKVFPMDIFPMQLVKACLNQDIERMEALGIYEVVPEDFGLIDFSSSSKIEAQEIIKKGIELIINEES